MLFDMSFSVLPYNNNNQNRQILQNITHPVAFHLNILPIF
uniref:Uncharacterized protein n=1 Tax=Rhizophora mucronata TaxID=61149 RepID=A0A2P2NZG0_RHIMU